jgi:hypothetical protein
MTKELKEIDDSDRTIARFERTAAEIDAWIDTKEVKRTADEAAAFKAVVRRLGLSESLRFVAAKVEVKAKHRLGVLAHEHPKHRGGRPRSKGKTPDNVSGVFLTLKELGITEHESSRCQLLANIPLKELDKMIAEKRAAGEPLLLEDFYNRAREIKLKVRKVQGETYTVEVTCHGTKPDPGAGRAGTPGQRPPRSGPNAPTPTPVPSYLGSPTDNHEAVEDDENEDVENGEPVEDGGTDEDNADDGGSDQPQPRPAVHQVDPEKKWLEGLPARRKLRSRKPKELFDRIARFRRQTRHLVESYRIAIEAALEHGPEPDDPYFAAVKYIVGLPGPEDFGYCDDCRGTGSRNGTVAGCPHCQSRGFLIPGSD